MHVTELIGRRHVPAAGVFAALTQRCPLSCRHCSTNSGPGGHDRDGAMFLRFVGSFIAGDQPDFLLLTGGEPLLRPGLVADLAGTARAAGVRTYVLTGAFFARQAAIPAPVWRAISAVDHVAVSVDAFHEEFVSRRQVFRAVHQMMGAGQDVSLQIVGWNSDDPYLAEVTEAVRREFADRVPILAGTIQAHGRGRTLPRPDAAVGAPASGLPCTLAAWPVIAPDGTITACCHQAVVDRAPLPAHLRLGHAAVDDWPQIRDRCLNRPLLRAIRLLGPCGTARLADEGIGKDGYCPTCWRLSDSPAVARQAAALGARPTTQLIEREVTALHARQGPAAFARRYGAARYAELVLLGRGDVPPPGMPPADEAGG